MARSVGFIDTTYRDGPQSLWATRMTTAMMLEVAGTLDNAGFQVLDAISAAHVEAAVRYLRENPWERLRLVRQRAGRTPLQAWLRSRNFISFDMMPDDLMELVYLRMHANGVRRFSIFDGLHDMDHIGFGVRVCQRIGAETCVPVIYSLSPIHTDEYYVRKAREIVDLGVDALLLKDPAALLTVDRVRTLVPALRQVVGDLPLEIHSHCLTGLGPLVLLEAVSLGVDVVYTAIPPLADGYSHPSVFNIADNLKMMGFQVNLDMEAIGKVSNFFTAVAVNEGLPMGQVAQYDLFHYQHQIPGGVISNLRSQLRDAGMEDRLRQVLEEIPRIRQELGWPVMVSPYSQFVSIQALINVMREERYGVVLDEIAKWAYGYYGKLEAPVDPNIRDIITHRASKRISPTPQPPEPMLAALRKAFPKADDDELVLRGFIKGPHVDQMLSAQPMKLRYEFRRDVVGLVKRLVEVADTGRVAISTAGLEFAWQR